MSNESGGEHTFQVVLDVKILPRVVKVDKRFADLLAELGYDAPKSGGFDAFVSGVSVREGSVSQFQETIDHGDACPQCRGQGLSVSPEMLTIGRADGKTMHNAACHCGWRGYVLREGDASKAGW